MKRYLHCPSIPYRCLFIVLPSSSPFHGVAYLLFWCAINSDIEEERAWL
jgi:hypothetical protein